MDRATFVRATCRWTLRDRFDFIYFHAMRDGVAALVGHRWLD